MQPERAPELAARPEHRARELAYHRRMGEWSAAVIGELSLGTGGARAWRARHANPKAHRDWPKPSALGAEDAGEVATLLARLGRVRGGTVALETSDERVRVRALFHAEPDHHWQLLVLALREAAPLGARGDVMIVDATEPGAAPPLGGVAVRLELDGTGSRLRQLRGADKRRALADPATFSAVMELLEGERRSAATPRQRAREASAARGDVRRAKASANRQALGGARAASQLAARAKKPFKTPEATRTASELLAKIVAEPSDAAERALAKAWHELVSRAPRPKALPEYPIRIAVGQALCRVVLPEITDRVLRAKLQAVTRTEWPDEKRLREALSALARTRGWNRK